MFQVITDIFADIPSWQIEILLGLVIITSLTIYDIVKQKFHWDNFLVKLSIVCMCSITFHIFFIVPLLILIGIKWVASRKQPILT